MDLSGIFRQILIAHSHNSNFPPAWLSVPAAAHYSGLSRTVLYRHIDAENLVTSTVMLPGKRRGRRLIQRESLDRLIEGGIGLSSCDNTRSSKRRPRAR